MNVYKKVLALMIFILLAVPYAEMLAQQPVIVKKSDNKVIIEGKVYYIHIVKPGQTLFSISKAYNVSEKDIAIENPGVYSGLQVGQMLKIPEEVPSRPDTGQQEKDTTRYIYHRLKPGENITALSRTYNIPVQEIRKANPNLDYTNLQIGQTILIPRSQSVYRDEDFIQHKVRRRDTYYSLSRRYDVTEADIKKYNPELQWGGLKTGQIIRIPKSSIVSQTAIAQPDTIAPPDTLALMPADTIPVFSMDDYAETLRYYRGKTLNVAFLIPFDYRKKPEPVEEETDENKPDEQVENTDQSEILPQSAKLLEFMEGSLVAVDSLRKAGLSMNIQYFDTHKSPSRTRALLSSPFFSNVDLIIGPFFPWNVEIVNEFSREHHVPLICPFNSNDSLTATNPFMFQLNPSYTTEYRMAARYLAKDFDKNFVFIYNADSLELNKVEYFKSELMNSLQNYTYSENAIIKEIVYDNIARADMASDLQQALSKDKKNIVIVPVADEAFVTAIVSQLYFQLRNFDIQVFGLPEWAVISNPELLYYHKLNLTYLTPYYYSFEDPKVEHFLAAFRRDFKAEPSFTTRQGCPFAFIGYDATFTFLDAIRKDGNMFVGNILSDHEGVLLPGFRFRRKSIHGGFENQALKVVRFQKDFTISVSDIAPEEMNKQNLPGLRLKPEIRHDSIPGFGN